MNSLCYWSISYQIIKMKYGCLGSKYREGRLHLIENVIYGPNINGLSIDFGLKLAHEVSTM